MEIKSQAEYEAAKIEEKSMFGKGGRLHNLHTRNLFGMDMSAEDRAEYKTLMARFTEIGEAMRTFSEKNIADMNSRAIEGPESC